VPVDEKITSVTFSFWAMNLLGKMLLATRMGGGGGRIFRILCTIQEYVTLSTTYDIQKLFLGL
jgi:hypothetical protein